MGMTIKGHWRRMLEERLPAAKLVDVEWRPEARSYRALIEMRGVDFEAAQQEVELCTANYERNKKLKAENAELKKRSNEHYRSRLVLNKRIAELEKQLAEADKPVAQPNTSIIIGGDFAAGSEASRRKKLGDVIINAFREQVEKDYGAIACVARKQGETCQTGITNVPSHRPGATVNCQGEEDGDV